MDSNAVAAWSAVALVALHFILSVRSGSWNMSDRLTAMESRIMAVIESYKKSDAEQSRRMEADLENQVRAVQAELHKFETWSRDEFVRRSSFTEALGRIERTLERVADKLEAVQVQGPKHHAG